MVPLNKPIKPPRYYLAGYVLNNEVTLKLISAMPDTRIPVLQLTGGHLPHCVTHPEKDPKGPREQKGEVYSGRRACWFGSAPGNHHRYPRRLRSGRFPTS